MTTVASGKAKGRRLQNEVRQRILDWASQLEPDDVKTALMGERGADIKLSPAAQHMFPFHGIECKNSEKLSVWKAMKQAKAHGGRPILFFSRNREETYVCVRADDFFEVM